MLHLYNYATISLGHSVTMRTHTPVIECTRALTHLHAHIHTRAHTRTRALTTNTFLKLATVSPYSISLQLTLN